jgi:hypothetical protein
VEYRKKGSAKWTTAGNIEVGVAYLYNLQFGKEYEYRVGSRCVQNDVFGYSVVKAFKMPDREERSPQCGLMPDSKITNRTPAKILVPGEPFMAGDFMVFITKVSGSGTFSGEGYVGIPYLKNAQVAVTFTNIVVNTDLQLVSGFVETKFDPVNNSLIFDVDKTLTGGKGVGDIRSGEEMATFNVNYNINPNIQLKPLKGDDGKDPIKDANGNYVFGKGDNGKYQLVFTDEKGEEHVVETEAFPFTITDGSGTTYEVTETGEVINTEQDLDEVIVQGQSNNYEVVINGETEKVTHDKTLKLVYEDQTLKMELRKKTGDSINADNIQWIIGGEEIDSVLTYEIRVTDHNITVAINEGIKNNKGKPKFKKIAAFEFVVRKSPYATFSTIKDYNGEFGFDDGEDFRENSVPKQNGHYQTIQVADENNKSKILYVPWLTLLQKDSANLKVGISQEIDGDNIYCESTSQDLVGNYVPKTKQLTIKNSTLNNDFMNPEYVNVYRDDKYKLQKHMLIGRVAVVGRQLISRTIPIQIIYFAKDTVKIKNTINSKILDDLLEKHSLNQSFAHFRVLPEIIRIKNTLTDNQKSSVNIAYSVIRRICENNRIKSKYSHNPDTIFIIQTDLEFKSSKEIGENIIIETKGGGVAYDENGIHNNLAIMWIVPGNKEKMIIHEIGHTLGLNDTFNDDLLGNPPKGFSRNNYMDYDIERKMFFKTQIETIINNLGESKK